MSGKTLKKVTSPCQASNLEPEETQILNAEMKDPTLLYLLTQIDVSNQVSKAVTDITDPIIERCMEKGNKLSKVKRLLVNVIKGLTKFRSLGKKTYQLIVLQRFHPCKF